MPVIRKAESRRTVTPNAVMITHASPTQGGTALAVWSVEMAPGAAGPRHSFDVEQVWTLLAGAASIELDGEALAVGAGDAIVMPAGVLRQVQADPLAGFTAVVAASAGARASTSEGEPVLPAWIA
ncbi:MAG TPA: cupin domain-containing protein [Pseudonocardiaceae bacterium]